MAASTEWVGPGEGVHLVQFYETDDFLSEAVARFVEPGLRAGAPVLLLATAAHGRAFAERLGSLGVELSGAQVLHLDADEALAQIMDGERLDPARFDALVGDLFDRCRAGREVEVWAYGEMVDLLWQAGRSEAALALEEVWGELQQVRRFRLLCGYALAGLRSADGVRRVCGAHDVVLPVEPPAPGSECAARPLAEHARVLTAEIAYRKGVERSLRESVRELRAAEAEREDLLERERVANRAKDEFLAMLGHELRNPLSPLVSALELMKLRLGDAGLREREIIERQTRLLVRLVDDLLDVSRITRGRIALRPASLDLAAVVADGIELAAPLIEQRGHGLRVFVAPGLRVSGDAQRLAQVLANLLTNAAKYTPDGGRIELTAERDGEQAVVRVRDDGAGIAPELQARVFEPFVQAERPLDRPAGGLGMGLAIVRSLVELHDGTVELHSAGVDQGSEFVVRLPAEPPSSREPSPARVEAP